MYYKNNQSNEVKEEFGGSIMLNWEDDSVVISAVPLKSAAAPIHKLCNRN
jgi:hypothetical protein